MTIKYRAREKKKDDVAEELTEFRDVSRTLARKLGLDPFPVKYWVVDYQEMLELMSYGGFPERYPHWRWGMKYEQQKKQQQFIGGKAFELVINDNPAHAYLQSANKIADQKAVMTHVEAHSDFFNNNYWYSEITENYNASDKISQHSEEVRDILTNYDVTKSEVEQWIDNLLCVEFNINPFKQYFRKIAKEENDPEEEYNELRERLKKQGVSDVVIEEAITEMVDEDQSEKSPSDDIDGERDLLLFFKEFGRQFNDDTRKAEEYTEWQVKLIEIVRSEAFYFAPQRMTKILNEGWATFWESMMMAGENLSNASQVITYADHLSKVTQANGFNPYKIGLDLWSYVENYENRDHVLTKLLQVENINPDNIYDKIEFNDVLRTLKIEELRNIGEYEKAELCSMLPDKFIDDSNVDITDEEFVEHPWKLLSYEGMAARHYSLLQRGNKSFITNLEKSTLVESYRYLENTEKYETVAEALDDIVYSVGWDKMFEARETHHDGTFIDKYMTEEFIEEYGYFAYEYNAKEEEYQVSGTDVHSVKSKLLLEFTNFGKPLISVKDMNFNNSGELLLQHSHNGINMDIAQAKKVLERLFELWGKPVNLETVVQEQRKHGVKNKGKRFSYSKKDGHDTLRLKPSELSYMLSDATYDTTPDDW